MSKTIADVRRLIESRLAETETEVKSLDRSVASLGNGPARRRPAPRRSSDGVTAAGAGRGTRNGSATRRGEPSTRAARGQHREELLAALEATPAARPSALAKSIGIRPTQVHALIAKARSEKLIVKDGSGYALKR